MPAHDGRPQPGSLGVTVWPDVAAGTFAAAFFIWLATAGQNTSTSALVDTLFFIPPGVAVAWMSWRTARLWHHDRATRRAWTLLGWAQFLYWLSGTIWTVLLVYAPAQADSSWTESLSLPGYAVALIAILSFPGTNRDESSRTRFFLDVALIFAGCALGFWYYSFRTAASPQTIRSGALLYTLIYPTADLGLMLVTGAAILKATHPTTRRALAWLFAARGAKVAATSVYSLLKFGGGHSSGQWTYAPGHWIDGLWFAAWVFAWIAARVPQYRLASGAVEPEREQRRSYRSGGLPVLSFLFAQGLLLWLLREELNAAAGIVAVATTLLTGLIALRQVAELKENERLRSLERSQEARFRSLVQQGSDILLVVGGGGELLYRSPSAERLIPRAGKEQEPSSLGALFDDVDVAGLRALIARVEPGRDAGSVPARALRADGKVMHLEFLATDLRHDPAVGGVVLTGWDVTERHELESELRHTEKLRAVGQTAGGIAHDLNNMLFAVRANTSLLLEDLPPDSPARAEAVEIGRAADRAAAVTRKLLQFSRREIAQPVTLDLNVVVAELEPVLRQFISSGIDVRFDYAPAEAWVVIDRLQMEQVVLNLSMNARDAMHDGGILRLRIDQAAAGHQPAGPGPTSRGEVAIEIEDNGIGMDEATKSHIFEPFFTTKPQGQGTGLGLATVYGIVTSAAGRLQVESSRGKGTTFTVFLPRASAPAEASRPEP